MKRRYGEDIRRLRTLLLEAGTLTLFLEGGTPIERGALARAILSGHGDPDGGDELWFAAHEDGSLDLPGDAGAGAWVIDRANSLSDESIGRLALSLHQHPRTLLLLSDFAEERLTELGTVSATGSEVLRLGPMDRAQTGEFLEQMLSGAVAASTLEALWSMTSGEVLKMHALVSEHLQRGSLVRVEGMWMIRDWGSATIVAAELSHLLDAESTLSASAHELLAGLSGVPEVGVRGSVPGAGLLGMSPGLVELERAGLVSASNVSPASLSAGTGGAVEVTLKLIDVEAEERGDVLALSRNALMADFAAGFALAEEALLADDVAAAARHLAQLLGIQARLGSGIAGEMLGELESRAAIGGEAPEGDWAEQAWLMVIEGRWDLLHETLSNTFGVTARFAPESAALMELLLGVEAFMQGKPGIARSHTTASIRLLPVPRDVTFARAAFALSAVIAAQAGRKKKASADLRRIELLPASNQLVVEGLASILEARARFILGDLAQDQEFGTLKGGPADMHPALAVLALFLGSAPTSETESDHVLAVSGTSDTPLAAALTATVSAMRNPTLEQVQRAIDVCATHRVRSLEKRLRHMLTKLSLHSGHRPGSASPDAGRSVFHGRNHGEGLRSLTVRENEVLDLLREGASNRDISEHLNVSVRTAESHVGRVLHKLGLARRHEVAHLKTDTGMLLPTVHANPDPVGGL